jgi:tRNA pseudouridine55 synthase
VASRQPPARHGRPAADVDGALIVDKPEGLTSHDVVAAVRRALGTRVGHTGTLDPMATGVLPLLLGRATRLARFLSGAPKTYEAIVRLGWSTDTYDATGQPLTEPRPALVAEEEVARALEGFTGTFLQRPPAFSAKKVRGERAYALARGEGAPELAAVSVTVHDLTLLSVEAADVRFRLTCSAGFYVRTLAHDLGHALGVGGHLARLRRIASGAFQLGGAVPLDAILTDARAACEWVIPLRDVLADWPAVRLTDEGLHRVRHGRVLGPEGIAERVPEAIAWVRLLAPDGSLAALGEVTGLPVVLRPAVVLM